MGAPRNKAIRFVLVYANRLVPLAQDYFQQGECYNDFSGGYKRHFATIDDDTLKTIQPAVMAFVKHFQLPEKTVILVQIQTSTFQEPVESDVVPWASTKSVTGQGIHTDGHDRAMIVCLGRGSGVHGAENQFHEALDGSSPLCEPKVLQPCHAAAFQDNAIYHYVTPGYAARDAHREDCTRTMLIMHDSAECVLWGLPNPNNRLGAKESVLKLRHSEIIRSSEITQSNVLSDQSDVASDMLPVEI